MHGRCPSAETCTGLGLNRGDSRLGMISSDSVHIDVAHMSTVMPFLRVRFVIIQLLHPTFFIAGLANPIKSPHRHDLKLWEHDILYAPMVS